jgi:hypothetical protein
MLATCLVDIRDRFVSSSAMMREGIDLAHADTRGLARRLGLAAVREPLLLGPLGEHLRRSKEDRP